MSASWPSSVPTTAQLRTLVNNLATSLTGNISNSVTTLPVADTTSFPSTGYVTIGTEAISYTGKTPTSFTGCTRGADGTTAATHSSGDTVNHFYVADHHNRAMDEVIAIAQNLKDRFGFGTAIVLGSGITFLLPAGTNLRCTTPDGAHVYEIGIDNNGNFGVVNQIS